MRSRFIPILLILIFTCIIAKTQIYADRTMPVKIEPVIYNNIRITAENSTKYNMGIVKAYNNTTGAFMWQKKIYNVGIFPNLEEDAQLVFIKEMKIHDGMLLVINEKNRVYKVDPLTGRVLNKIYTSCISQIKSGKM